MSHKYVYLFTEGNGSMRELLGGKGANLAEMTNIGLPVPQGFTISTEACTKYYDDGRQINADIQAEIMANVDKLEAITGKKFGDKVVVRPQQTASDGQIVVARIGDEATVKRLRRRGGEIWLMPENDNYAPIDGSEAEIIGLVKAVVREY